MSKAGATNNANGKFLVGSQLSSTSKTSILRICGRSWQLLVIATFKIAESIAVYFSSVLQVTRKYWCKDIFYSESAKYLNECYFALGWNQLTLSSSRSFPKLSMLFQSLQSLTRWLSKSVMHSSKEYVVQMIVFLTESVELRRHGIDQSGTGFPQYQIVPLRERRRWWARTSSQREHQSNAEICLIFAHSVSDPLSTGTPSFCHSRFRTKRPHWRHCCAR